MKTTKKQRKAIEDKMLREALAIGVGEYCRVLASLNPDMPVYAHTGWNGKEPVFEKISVVAQ